MQEHEEKEIEVDTQSWQGGALLLRCLSVANLKT